MILLALAALAMATSTASAADLPQKWDPRRVAVNHNPENTFLLRPGQILAAPGDGADVSRVLTDWKAAEGPYGVTVFQRPVQNPLDPAKEVLDAIAKVRRATASRAQGPARVAPNHVFVGEAAAINFMGEPRIQGGPGSTVRPAQLPAAMPLRTKDYGDGKGARIAVLDTGMFDHPWLAGVQAAPNSDDVWDVESDGYADAESGHGTFIAGLIRQVAPSTEIYAVKALDSHGVGDDLGVAKAMAQLPADVDIVNLSLGGYTDRDQPPLAVAEAMVNNPKRVVVAAAGNHGATRPFWPAAFEDVLAIGAADESKGGWMRAPYSNHGKWVDATARGSNLESTFGEGKTKIALGSTPSPLDPTIAFEGWARWDGTSFATPIAAALVARTMSRTGLPAADAQVKLLANAPAAPTDFPNAVLLDEL
ncbi:MAG TPA: S8/S53 family peptidase [Solirubrobacter sp.]|nr:S8/S53 family peptidase [Solirubrobacter sp.]